MKTQFKVVLLIVIVVCGLVIYQIAANASPAISTNKTIIINSCQPDLPVIKTEAHFIGGDEKWKKFLMQKINPDIPNRNRAPDGRYITVVRFMINPDSSVSNIFIIKNPGYGTGEELARVIKLSSKKWVPAVSDKDEKTIVSREQPFTFVVSTATRN